MSHFTRYRLLLILLLCSLSLSAVSAQDTTAAQNSLTDCPFGMPPDEVIGTTALCGEITVPENWQQPELLAATDAIVPVEPRYLETVGLMSVVSKINDVREGWRHPSLRISGILVTKMDSRIRGHKHLLDELKAHSVLGKLLLGVIPANEAVSYAHQVGLAVLFNLREEGKNGQPEMHAVDLIEGRTS